MLVITQDGESWTTEFYPISKSDINLVRTGEFKYFRFNKEKDKFEQLRIVKSKMGKFSSRWVKVD